MFGWGKNCLSRMNIAIITGETNTHVTVLVRKIIQINIVLNGGQSSVLIQSAYLISNSFALMIEVTHV